MGHPFRTMDLRAIEDHVKARKPYQILSLSLATARTNFEISPTVPEGWDVIAVVTSTNQTDAVTIRFPDKQGDGISISLGRKIRLKGGIRLPRFYLTNSAITGATMTIFIGGETGADFDIASAVEVVTTIPTRSSVAVDGVVSVLTASTTVIRAANADRKSLLIQNIGANRIWVGVDNAAAADICPFIDPGAGMGFEYYTGGVWGRADTGNTNLAFIEVS